MAVTSSSTQLNPRERRRRSRGAPLSLLLLAAAVLSAGCGGRTRAGLGEIPDAGSDGGELPPLIEIADKLDVLLVVDNTQTSSFARQSLAATIPYLLDRLVHPRCVNGLGDVKPDPPNPGDPCPEGRRDFAPLTDIHLGVISTSLGGHGADTCSPASSAWKPEQNDRAHLLDRNADGGTVPTYNGDGYLVWDPAQQQTPPGDADLDALTAKLMGIIDGVGEDGCGFEAPLEAVYRFLVDPDPYNDIAIADDAAVPVGTDLALLSQRQAFLRPDSAVLVILLSDENDCSTRDGGQYYYSNQGQQDNGAPYHLPRARSECEEDPNDPCCTSCGAGVPDGCPASSPACAEPPFDGTEDPLNLRCFDQKRRFGIDFLYPVDRYVEGLSSPQVADHNGDVHDSPLFAGGRAPELVLLAGIVGLPWQDVALSPNDLGAGLQPAQLIKWENLLPHAATGEPPRDPFMVESRPARSGQSPVTGDVIKPPSAASPYASPINGHEHALPDDLQFACIYELAAGEDCSVTGCECNDPTDLSSFNPTCQAAAGDYQKTQRFGRTTPSTRQLEVLRDLGGQAVVASVCHDQLSAVDSPDFGFKPAVNAILRALKRRLVPAPEAP